MISRRRFLGGLTLASVGAVTLLAGCTDGRAADEGRARVPNEPDYKGWFDGVSNYDRTLDLRGQDRVTIRVGADGNTGAFAFGPAAVAVSPGTTVVWEWTGKGGMHNVVARSGVFDSGALVRDGGHTFEHSFDTPGVYPYLCEPHDSMGMRGAIFVSLGAAGS